MDLFCTSVDLYGRKSIIFLCLLYFRVDLPMWFTTTATLKGKNPRETRRQTVLQVIFDIKRFGIAVK